MTATYKTWVEIDTGILRANIRLLQEAVGPDCQIILVVKSDAYGHGAHTVAKVASESGVGRFAVASVAEGVALRKMEIPGEIVVLHPLMDFEVETALKEHLSPTVSDIVMARSLSRKTTRPIGVHIEVNTGINRLGIDWSTAGTDIAHIADLPNLKIQGVFTHFRASRDGDNHSVDTQMERFEGVLRDLRERGVSPGLVHAASSHAVARFRSSHLDGVRPGMIMYAGVGGPSTEGAELASPILNPLTRMGGVMSVRARVLMTRTVQKGEWIHYGDAFQAPRNMEVAVLPIGYGMGYPRSLSNNADVLISGRRVPVVGVIGMDMTIVGINQISGVHPGSIATILGSDGKESITLHELARRAGTIPYEIACRLGNALPRIAVESEGPKNTVISKAVVRDVVS